MTNGTHRRTPRYPLQPLLDAAHIERITNQTKGGHHTGDPLAGYHHLAQLLGVTQRTIHRLATNGLSERQADHYAIRLGLHPAHIWPTLWWSLGPSELDCHIRSPQ